MLGDCVIGDEILVGGLSKVVEWLSCGTLLLDDSVEDCWEAGNEAFEWSDVENDDVLF